MSSNCLLCFIEYIPENPRTSNPPELSETSSKYLHFAFTEEPFQSSHEDLSFCRKCFESTMKVVHFKEQMEYYQRKISELVLTLENLHRSRKLVDTDSKIDMGDIHSGKQLTNLDHESQIDTPIKDVFTANFDDSSEFPMIIDDKTNIEDMTFEEFKCEISQQHLNDETIITESSIVKENEVIRNLRPEVEKQRSPLLKLHRLKFLGNRKEKIVNESGRRLTKDQNKIVWTKIDSAVSYKMSDLNRSPSSSNNCLENLELLPNPVSTATSSNSTTISLADGQTLAQSRICSTKISGIKFSNGVYDKDRNLQSCEEKHFVSHSGAIRLEGQLNNNTIHSGKRRHHCSECQKEFKHGRNLLQHIALVHQKVRQYNCDVCGRTFARQPDLLRHKRIHTGERPYKCDVCRKAFTQSSNLIAHRRMHSGERPYKCDICDKKFTAKRTLGRHKRKHTDEKPFVCDKCDFASPTSSDLEKHKIHRHSAVNNFKCRECKLDFKFGFAVKRHYKRVHFALDFSDDCVIKKF